MLPDFDSMLKPYGFHFCRFGQTTSSRTLPIQPGLLVGLVWVALVGSFLELPVITSFLVTDTVCHKASLQFWLFVPGNPPVKHGNFGQQKTHGFRLEKRKNMRLMDSFDLHAGPCVWYVSCFTYLCHDLRVTLHGASGRWLPLLVCLVVWVKI